MQLRTIVKGLVFYFAIVAAGAIGFFAMRACEAAWVIYAQHQQMWQWAQDTDRLIHPDRYAPPPAVHPAPPPNAPTPEPTPTKK